MRFTKKGAIAFSLAATVMLMQPFVSRAFELIELSIAVDLETEEEFSLVFDQQQLPNTGFTIANPNQTSVALEGETALVQSGLQDGEEVQDGFVLLDNTLLLQLAATDEAGGRAQVRTTYRMDVDSRRLEPPFLEALLVRRQVVQDSSRAAVRASSMELADARVMRFVTTDTGGTWVRAVREIRAGTEKRFVRRNEPDGVLGHYGNFTDTSENPYVWAVMDRNSKYAVGLTVDRDDDGVPNSDDNCIGVANPDQSDSDGDFAGNACDSDDDNDSILDVDDNCPLNDNSDQLDFDGDGIGDVCDADTDDDGVSDGVDQCPQTYLPAPVDENGCSIDDSCPCENDWKNHGAYVRCVARTSDSFLAAGLITEVEKGQITSLAAAAVCGFQN